MCRMLPDLSVKLLISPKLSYNESFSIAEHIRRVEGHIERFSHLQQKWSKSLWSCHPFWPNTENQISTQSDVGRPVVNHIHEDTQDLEGVKQVLRDVRFISIKTDPEFEWMKETLYHYCLCWAHRFWQRQPHPVLLDGHLCQNVVAFSWALCRKRRNRVINKWCWRKTTNASPYDSYDVNLLTLSLWTMFCGFLASLITVIYVLYMHYFCDNIQNNVAIEAFVCRYRLFSAN